MKDEIKEIELWKEKTKGIFHIIEYKKFWDYITNLQEENDRHFKEAIRYENACDELEIRIDKAIEYCKILYDDNTSMNSQKEIAFRVKEIMNILQGEDKDE